MSDVNVLIRNWLLSSTALATQQGGSRVWVGGTPSGFDPAQGTGVVIFSRGGKSHPEIPDMHTPSLQVDVWGPAGAEGPNFRSAWKTYLVLRAFMHGKDNIDRGADGYIMASREEVYGQLSFDPNTRWSRVISYYAITAR